MKDIVQLQNPKSKTWIVIDRNEGKIIKHSPTSKPYKNIPIIDKNTPEYKHGIEPIHGWFELTYAQYLTIPRSVLQSMPVEWQTRFVECLNELDKAIDWRPKDACYWVSLRGKDGRFMPISHDPYMDYERGRRRIPLLVRMLRSKTNNAKRPA